MTQARLSLALGFLALTLGCGKAPSTARRAMSSGSGAPASSPAAGGFAPDQVGLNVGDLSDPSVLATAVASVKDLHPGWVRVEIVSHGDASQVPYWTEVVTRFKNTGVRVLAVLSNQSWNGFAQDPDAADSCGGGGNDFTVFADAPPTAGPNASGDQLANPALPSSWISQVAPYVNALVSTVDAWELWNEADGPPTFLCPGNYAYLLVSFRQNWPSIAYVGTSLTSLGDDTLYPAPQDYVSMLAATDKAQWWGSAPWTVLMTHAYPGDDGSGDFVAEQVNALAVVQSAPVWLTEVGWQVDDSAPDGDPSSSASVAANLSTAYEDASRAGAARTFWFSVDDCAGPWGLTQGCPAPSLGPARAAYAAFQALTSGSSVP